MPIKVTLFTFSFLKINKIMVWNCRGMGNRDFLVYAKLCISNVNPDVLVLLETKVSSDKAKKIFSSLALRIFMCIMVGVWLEEFR